MDPGRQVVIVSVPWTIRVLGLLLSTVGAFFAVILACGLTQIGFGAGPERRSGPADAWMPMIPMLIGLGMAFARHREWLDGGRRSRFRAVGWGWWVRETETPIGPVSHVEIGSAE